MKRIFLTLWFVLSFLSAVAQTNEKYVVHVEKNGNLLYVYMNPDEYDKLPDKDKKVLVKSEANNNNVTSVYVISAHHGELWQETTEGVINRVDSWDTNTVAMLPDNNFKQMPARSLKHPWFFNVSGALCFNSPNFYFNLYGRYGFFLRDGKWDLAANLLIGYNKSKGSKGSFSNSIGVDSRMYFPMKRMNINPFVGVGMSFAFGGGNKSFVMPTSLGLNVPLWKGCLDACWQYDKVNKNVLIIGYTFMFK